MEFHGVANKGVFMGKIGLVIDSTVYLPQKIIDDNNIKVVSLNVVNGVDSYREVEVDNQFIWDMQDKGANWKTSQPSPGEFLEAYETLFEEGCDNVLAVLLSRNISGTYQSANLARNMLENPKKVYLFDTMLCAYGTEMIALEVIDMIRSKIELDDIKTRINNIINTSDQMFTVQNLFSLTKGGRLSVAKAAIGTVLRVKPVVQVVNGKLELVKSERTIKKLNKYLLDSIRNSMKNENSKLTFYVTSQNSFDTANDVRELLLSEFPGSKLTFTEYLGPVFSIHIGKKGYGISWFVE